MTHASLFSGIGGFDLAAQWSGFDNVFCCEIDTFCQKVLKYHFPKTKLYEDVKTTNFKKYNGAIDIISGGFPCQPFSNAGKRKGSSDNRFLWAEMYRAICEIKPRWVIAENVRGVLNIENGLVFEQVCTDLETIGYEVQPFIIPACSQNAPHKRDRVWIIAYSANPGIKDLQNEWQERVFEAGVAPNTNETSAKHKIQSRRNLLTSKTCGKRYAANARCSERKNWIHGAQQKGKAAKLGNCYTKFGQFSKFPITEPTICGRNDGFPSKLDGITFSKWRNESIKAYGNAIVPQVACQIFRAIKYANKL
ncbi:MAG: DNA cytosine methyltransferase [Bacteroidales bacterium]